MASKQLGKLRQWGKEVISTKDKTIVTEEFKQLEKDIELRQAGIEKIQEACSEYHGYLHKKKEYPNVEEGVKMLPIDALGIVMIAHGEEFGNDSAFGQCLIKFGRAQCKIATLQESFASIVRDGYISSLGRLLGDFENYEMLRKKLDSRRLAYDAAMSKVSKAKKDKDIKEAEEEHSKAKVRYEETSSEVQMRMRRIQANEFRQLKDLTSFLENQIQFASQCLAELREVREDWCDESTIERRTGSSSHVTPHSFAHDQSRSIASVSRKRMAQSNGPSSIDEDDMENERSDSTGADKDDAGSLKGRSSPASRHSSKTPSLSSRPSSRSSLSSNTAHYSSNGSVSRRKRSNSATSSVASSASESTKRSGVTGWLSGSTRGKKDKQRRKDKDRSGSRAFASLENDSGSNEDDATSQKGRESDSRSSANANPSTPGGAISRMFSTAQRPLSMNLSNKGSSASSISSFADFRDTHESDTPRDLSFEGKEIKRQATNDWNRDSSAPRLSSSTGDNTVSLYKLSEKKPSSSAQLNSSSSLPSNNTLKKTSIAQRAELEMLRTREYEPSINSMDDDLRTPLPTLSYPPFTPFSGNHYIENKVQADGMNSENENEVGKANLLLERDGHENKPFSANLSPFETETLDPPVSDQSKSRVDVGNESGQLPPRAGPPPLPSRKQSTRKVPPPPPPPPARYNSNVGSTSTGGSSNSSTLSIGGGALGAVSFPPPPPRSRNVPTPADSLTVSPFDN